MVPRVLTSSHSRGVRTWMTPAACTTVSAPSSSGRRSPGAARSSACHAVTFGYAARSASSTTTAWCTSAVAEPVPRSGAARSEARKACVNQPGTPVTVSEERAPTLRLGPFRSGAGAPLRVPPQHGLHADDHHVDRVQQHAPDEVDARSRFVGPVHGLVEHVHAEPVHDHDDLDAEHPAFDPRQPEDALGNVRAEALEAALAVDDGAVEHDDVREDL